MLKNSRFLTRVREVGLDAGTCVGKGEALSGIVWRTSECGAGAPRSQEGHRLFKRAALLRLGALI
jgi:hypothetical protein